MTPLGSTPSVARPRIGGFTIGLLSLAAIIAFPLAVVVALDRLELPAGQGAGRE